MISGGRLGEPRRSSAIRVRDPHLPLVPARLAAVLRLDSRFPALRWLDFLPAPERVVAAAALRAGLRWLLHPCLPLFREYPFTVTAQCALGSRPAPDSVTQSRASATTTDCGPAPAAPATSTVFPSADSLPAQDPS